MPITINGNGAISGLGDIDGHDLETATLVVSGDTTIAPQAVGRASLFVDDSANTVGINTTTPSTLLEVQGKGDKQVLRLTNPSNTDTAIAFNDSSNATGNAVQLGSKSGEFQFVTNSLERVRIASGGNVGIGTTSPNALLDITDSSNEPKLRLSTATASNFLEISRSSSTGHYTIASEETGSSIIVATDPDGTGTQNRVTIDRYGNVGIGVTNPSVLLHLERTSTTAYNSAATTNDSTLLILNNGASGHATLQFQSLSGGTAQTGQATISAFNEADGTKDTTLTFGTRQNSDSTVQERMRIDSAGHILMGATSSTAGGGGGCKLQIREDGFGRHLELLRSYDSSNTPSRIWLSASRGSAASPTIQQDGDAVGEIRFHSYDGNDYNSEVAGITVRVDGTPGTNDTPGRLMFSTTADGASSVTERMRITKDGKTGIGLSTTTPLITEPWTNLHVNGANVASPVNARNANIPTGNLHVSTNAYGANEGGSISFGSQPDNVNNYAAYGSIAARRNSALGYEYAGYLAFSTSDGTNLNERMRILSGGGITFNGDTSTNNALDDYEEGTWTPVYSQGVSGATYSNTSGNYTKTGNLVTFTGRIQASAGTNVGSQQLMISGLPYTSSASSMEGGAFFNFRGSLNTSSSSSAGPFLHITKGESRIKFYSLSGNTWVGSDGAGAVGQTLHFQGYYFV